jgi:uncharacterized protein (DUF305 family)
MRTVAFTRTMAAVLAVLILMAHVATPGLSPQGATPEAPFRCDEVAIASPKMGTPSNQLRSVPDAGVGTSLPDPEPTVATHGLEFDQVYIDLIIPHHQSIIALARTALPRLSDTRLIAIAKQIINREDAELTQLRLYREAFYGSVGPMPLDASMMDRVAEAMPLLPNAEAIKRQLDREALISVFCTADDPDLAFIDITLAHQKMAITASVVAFMRAVHPEIHTLAKQMVEAQQREIDELAAIRAELLGTGTPTS